jgi:hypothetical protein
MANQPQRELWEQLPDEPTAAYARFLVYRNLGSGRTLDAAYAVYSSLPQPSAAPRPAPGNWNRQSVRWRWVERCGLWDVEQMVQHGRRIVLRQIEAAELLSAKMVAMLKQTEPKDFGEAMKVFALLLNLVDSDALVALTKGAAEEQAALQTELGEPALQVGDPTTEDTL